jgi:hypothetical protein
MCTNKQKKLLNYFEHFIKELKSWMIIKQRCFKTDIKLK